MDEDDRERLREIRVAIAKDMERQGVYADAFEVENDVWVEGPLTAIAEVYRDWRSEVDEELG